MAQQVYRANLSAKVFPLVAEYFGRSVIVAGQDQNFSRQLGSTEDPDKDRGIPQIYYCHNVMPSSEGLQSIGYTQVITDTKSGFINQFTLRDVDGNQVFFSATSFGDIYVLPFGETLWMSLAPIAGIQGKEISIATINGQSYVFFSGIGCYLYDRITNAMIKITLDGLDETQVLGIVASAGYMIAWTDKAIAWSSAIPHEVPTDPIDFVPSEVTGAGGGNVESAKGKLTVCVQHYLGFIIYTTNNTIGAIYTNNANYPFNLREMPSGGGLSDPSLISSDSGTGNHYAFTTSGLQLVSIQQAQLILPEVTDFTSGKYFEDFDESTLKFIRTKLSTTMLKSVNIISDRYLVISYGVTELTHALVYDVVMKRFGKLKQTHTVCFEWKQLNPDVVDTPRQSIGFLKSNGSIFTVDFAYGSPSSYGVMLLGKYQLARTRLTSLQHVEIENVREYAPFKLYNCVSYNGKTLEPAVEGYLAERAESYRKYNFHQTGINHTLIFIGDFYADSLVIKFNINGRV